MRRVLACSFAALTLALGVSAGTAGAQTTQNGLVNLNLENVTVQVPIGVAANVCDVNVAVLANLVDTGATQQCSSIANAAHKQSVLFNAKGMEQEIWQAAMRRVLAIPEYVTMFSAAFPGMPTDRLGFQHAATAIAAFEMQPLTKTDSPFDRYLNRDDAALTLEQKRGALLFFGDARCSS